MSVNPLAIPKGTKVCCELCQKPAYCICEKCRVTYYCDKEHKEEDWVAIHEKICPMLALLRSPTPHANSEEEREHRRHQQALRRKHIIDVCLEEAHRFLYEDHPSCAVPAALEALKFLAEAHGSASIEVTPAYLIVAEATIGLGRLREAEQYLSQAQWSVLRTQACEPSLKARLHRNLGQLEAARGNISEAKRHFAEDIYQSSIAYSPTAIQTSGGYYHLGMVFYKEGNHDCAFSLHDQVINIWFNHLSKLMQDMLEQEKLKQQSGHLLKTVSHNSPPQQLLNVAQRAEVEHTLHSIRDLREHQQHPAAATKLLPMLYHTLALLYFVTGDMEKSLVHANKASQFQNKDSIEELVRLIKQAK